MSNNQPINDGGPAFPASGQLKNNGIRGPGFAEWFEPFAQGGMSLLDYFAAKAMQTLIHDWCEGDPKHRDDVAKHSYAFARAMLAARATSTEAAA